MVLNHACSVDSRALAGPTVHEGPVDESQVTTARVLDRFSRCMIAPPPGYKPSMCILCFCEHTNTWGDGPSMYCEYCGPVRQAARGTTSHIVGTLYLSDMEAAKGFTGFRMCVHEDGPVYEGQCLFVPILTSKPKSKFDRSGAVASVEALDQAAAVIHDHVSKAEDILVHCVGGIERSPLALAWYLVTRAKQFATLKEAYVFLKQKRPVVSDRLFWLPPQQ